MQVNVKNCLLVVVSVFALLVTFDTVWLLASFLSYHPLSTRNESACQESFSESLSRDIVITGLGKDGLLLVLFIFQHSLMAHLNVPWILETIGLEVLARTLYVLASCACLQGLMHYWQPVDSICLWNAQCSGWLGKSWLYALVLVHFLSWFLVYGGCLLVDVGELIGMKQVLYYVRGYQDPLKCKTEGLRRYYKHMRHPSFIGFCMVLWAIPQMSLDRALLAVQLTIYMFLAWRTDKRDISYLRYQLEDKEINAVNGDWHHSPYHRKQY